MQNSGKDVNEQVIVKEIAQEPSSIEMQNDSSNAEADEVQVKNMTSSDTVIGNSERN